MTQAPLPRLVARHTTSAPLEAAWDVLVDTRTWPRWGPSVSAVDCDHRRIALGSRGRLRTPVGVWVPFTVTEFTAGESWSWSVGGIRATSHHVRPVPGGAEIVFGVPWWAPAYLAVCDVAVRRIATLAETRPR